jgi:hypothetical protein
LKKRLTPRELARLHPVTYVRGWRQRALFADVEKFCLFIGYPRSGSSLVGSLLDAHPCMAIAHELDVLRFVDARFTRRQLYHLLLMNAREACEGGRVQTGYSYAVPNQWQGRFERLRVIGDKKGPEATRRLSEAPELLDRLAETVGVPIKMIHVVRNPFDTISTMARRPNTREPKAVRGPIGRATATRRFFKMCNRVVRLGERMAPRDLITVRHETVMKDPTGQLLEICHFLGVSAPDDYLRDCASIVFPTPHVTRHDIDWPPDAIEEVSERIQDYPFLEGYAFDAATPSPRSASSR